MSDASYGFSAPATLTMLPDPILKPGWWEVVFTESTRKDFVSAQNLCAGSRAQEVELAKKEFDETYRACELTDVQSGKNLVSYTGECTRESGITTTSRIVLKGDFSSDFTKTGTTSFSIAMPNEGMTQIQRFKYRGACPKDMMPGDSVIKNGNDTAMPKWNRYNRPQSLKNSPKT